MHTYVAAYRGIPDSGIGGMLSVSGQDFPRIKLDQGLDLVVVEDEPSHARLLELTLRAIGVTNDLVTIAYAGEALEFLACEGRYAERTPNNSVVLLDLNLPDGKGQHVLRELRTEPRTAQVPVIVVTSSDDPDERDECIAMGANGYLVKPPTHDELAAMFLNLGLAGPTGGPALETG